MPVCLDGMAVAFKGERPLIVGDITELRVVGAFDRGIPNEERIVLQVNEVVNLGQFALLLGIRQQSASAVPIRDNLFWFGDGILSRGDWIFVYTGPGEGRLTDLPGTTEKLYTVHWGRTQTILNSLEVVPVLVRVDAVQIPVDMRALPGPSMQKA